MNFLLQKLESHIDELSLIGGEELLEAGAVEQLSEAEKHLWLAIVEGYEVEVQVTPSRVVGGTCECMRFREEGGCEHLAAALLALRRKQEDKKAQQRQKERPAAAPAAGGKLTTGIVLEHVSKEDLIEFVREYARANRNFAIDLKARFASAVAHIDPREKYAQLLESTINGVRKPDRSLTSRGGQRVLSVLEELQQQAVQAVEEGNFTETACIAQSIIEKATPILKKAKGQEEQIRTYIHQAFGNLERVIRRRPAPAMLRELWGYSMAEYGKLAYRSQGIDLLFFKLLLLLAQEAEQMEELLLTLEQHRSKYQHEKRPEAPLLLLQLQALEKAGRADQAKQLMEYNLSQPDILQYAIKQAREKGLIPRVKALAMTGLKLGPPSALKAELEEMLLQMAEAGREKADINYYSLERFLDTLQFPYFEKARRHATKARWTEQVDEVLHQLRTRPYSAACRNTIARIYAEEGRFELLMDYAEELNSLDLLQQVGGCLLETFQDRLFHLYRRLLADYAKNHLGRQTSRKIREVLAHLQEIGAGTLAEELIQGFRATYPERHSLMEELALLE
jgi:hypothetical protein